MAEMTAAPAPFDLTLPAPDRLRRALWQAWRRWTPASPRPLQARPPLQPIARDCRPGSRPPVRASRVGPDSTYSGWPAADSRSGRELSSFVDVTWSSATSTIAAPTDRAVGGRYGDFECAPPASCPRPRAAPCTRSASAAGTAAANGSGWPASSGRPTSVRAPAMAGSLRCQPASSPPVRWRSVSLDCSRSSSAGVEVHGIQLVDDRIGGGAEPDGSQAAPAGEIGSAAFAPISSLVSISR